MNCVLGMDLGTQALKAVFYNYETKTVEEVVSSPLAVDRDASGKAEQRADWWLAALADCLDQADSRLRQGVRAIAVSGQQHGFVPLDASGNVLAPVKLWCDTATGREVEEITRACGGRDQAIALTGNPVLAGYTSPKIRWLKNHHPQIYRQLAHILLPHDYLNYILTGELAMEYGDASGTGLLDVRTRTWSPDMLAAVDSERDLSACLPPLHEPGGFIGATTRDTAARYGLPEGIPVATGGGDNMMAAIGTGNVKPGELTISLGSSGTLYAFSDEPVVDPAGNIAAFCSSTGGWLPLLCTMNCTLATELIRQPLNILLDAFDDTVAQAPPGSDGLITLPFFNGERTPDLPRARASIFGISSHNCTRGHLLRSTLEGTCFALKYGYDELARLGLGAREISLTGGGSHSHVWRQIIADIFQLPVVVHHGDEGASFGAALQALWVLQKQEDPSLGLDSLCAGHLAVDTERCKQPNGALAGIYREAYDKYQAVLKQLTPLLEQRQ